MIIFWMSWDKCNMVITCPLWIHVQKRSFNVINLYEKPTCFQSILRQISNEEKTIGISEWIIQCKRRRKQRIMFRCKEKFRRICVSFFVEFRHRRKCKRIFIRKLQSIMIISNWRNGGWNRFIKLFLIIQFSIESHFTRVDKRSMRLIQIACVDCINQLV